MDFNVVVGGHIKDVDMYGVGCTTPHDEDTLACSAANECASIIPFPLGCDKNFCSKAWCWVDEACSLLSNPSTYFKGRDYSDATCVELDRFAQMERLQSL